MEGRYSANVSIPILYSLNNSHNCWKNDLNHDVMYGCQKRDDGSPRYDDLFPFYRYDNKSVIFPMRVSNLVCLVCQFRSSLFQKEHLFSFQATAEESAVEGAVYYGFPSCFSCGQQKKSLYRWNASFSSTSSAFIADPWTEIWLDLNWRHAACDDKRFVPATRLPETKRRWMMNRRSWGRLFWKSASSILNRTPFELFLSVNAFISPRAPAGQP